MREDSKRSLHLKILQSVFEIESWDLAKRAGLMVNTSNKYVKWLRDEGYTIITCGVEGQSNCKYQYVSGPQQTKECPKVDNIDKQELIVMKIDDPLKLKKMCLESLRDYPENHPQYAAILQQCNELDMKMKRVA